MNHPGPHWRHDDGFVHACCHNEDAARRLRDEERLQLMATPYQRPCPMCGTDLLDGRHKVDTWQGATFLACPSAPPGVVVGLQKP